MRHLTIWYVVADGGRARFVQRRDGDGPFITGQEIESAAIHRASHELGTDRPGRTYESAASATHAVQPREDLHAAAKKTFAHEVAAALNEAGSLEKFDRLVLVAPVRFLGELRTALDPATQRRVAAELQKDLTKVPDADLATHLAGLKLA
jgi:protein required for attachment to host cells